MPIMEITDEELSLILDKRKEAEALKPTKVAYLKEDLYSFDARLCYNVHSSFLLADGKKFITDLDNSIKLAIPAGTRFFAYENAPPFDSKYMKDAWYDEINDYCWGDQGWADKHLHNFSYLE